MLFTSSFAAGEDLGGMEAEVNPRFLMGESEVTVVLVTADDVPTTALGNELIKSSRFIRLGSVPCWLEVLTDADILDLPVDEQFIVFPTFVTEPKSLFLFDDEWSS